MSDKKQEELEEWINQVYYGNCCSHPDDEDCKIDLQSKDLSDVKQPKKEELKKN
jgi:hypothetical protein